MLNAYIILYQYFDIQEIKLKEQIETIQQRIIYRDCRSWSEDEAKDLLTLKIKLEFLQQIQREILKLFME